MPERGAEQRFRTVKSGLRLRKAVQDCESGLRLRERFEAAEGGSGLRKAAYCKAM